MLDRTSSTACWYVASGRFCSLMAAVNASITVPSSATVVPAMSRQATVILVIERLLRDRRGTCHAASAWPGDQDHAGLDLGSVVQAVTGRGIDLAVDAGPAALRPR